MHPLKQAPSSTGMKIAAPIEKCKKINALFVLNFFSFLPHFLLDKKLIFC